MGNPTHDLPPESDAEKVARLLASMPPAEVLRLLSGGSAQSIGNVQNSTVVQAANSRVIVRVFQSVNTTIKDAEADALCSYLHHSDREWRALPLAGLDVDHANAESSSGQPELDRVYVGLNVVDPRPATERSGIPKGEEGEEGLADRNSKPWPALAACIARRRLVLLGEPGSGKSTFLRMLALQLSASFSDAGSLKTAAVLPDNPADGDTSLKKSADPTEFGEPLMPIFVTLRDFAAASIEGEDNVRLTKFIQKDLTDRQINDVWPTLRRLLQDGRAIALLDGLDEIAGSAQRDAALKAVRGFAALYPRTRIIVTCRVAAYVPPVSGAPGGKAARPDWRLPPDDFPSVTLASFNDDQIRQFVHAWYKELRNKRRLDDDPVRKASDLLGALKRSHIRRLAVNPLLLTVTALVHGHLGVLPDERVTLYKEAVDMLLHRWRQGRRPGPSADSDPSSVAAILRQQACGPNDLLQRLWELAWNIHGKTMQGGPNADEAVADIEFQTLLAALKPLHPEGCRIWTARLIEAIKLRSGLLVERRDELFTFPHRTFQEYLAAQHLARLPDWTGEAFRLRLSPNNLWREVILLAAGTYAHTLLDTAKAVPLLERLIEVGVGNAGFDDRHAALTLAADVVCEMTVAKLEKVPSGKDAVERLRAVLLKHQFDDHFKLGQRSSFGTALGRVGDQRAEIVPRALPSDRQGYRKLIAWSRPIPAGAFPMGDEKPPFQCGLITQPYAVSLYPITVGQYRLFVQAGGYRTEGDRYWTAAGMAWRDAEGIDGPEAYDEVFQTQNHPQVGVSWYEATAFCRWLAEVSGLPVRMPTEPEWERAARHTDAREYPWAAVGKNHGEIVDHANVWEGNIRHTSLVGLFADGAAECGALDMAGNVWEWCGSKWTDNYEGYEKAHDSGDDGDSSRVLRGGSWNFNQVNARCANRRRRHPHSRSFIIGFRVCVSPFSSSEL